MQSTIDKLGKDFAANDYVACKGVVDYILNERLFSVERLIEFLCSVYKISEVQAIEVLEMLDVWVIN